MSLGESVCLGKDPTSMDVILVSVGVAYRTSAIFCIC